MLRKRGIPEDVVGHGTCKARSLWVKLDCLNPNPDSMHVPIHRKNV